MAKTPKIVPAHQPARYDEEIMAAVRACASKVATPGQAFIALNWIINEVCLTYDQPYRPGADGDRETAFACGRQFCGQQIVKVMKTVSIEPKGKA